jgi:hypothetical protein
MDKKAWFIYLGTCKGGDLNYEKSGTEWSGWLDAFNATTFVGWRGEVLIGHSLDFEAEFFRAGWLGASQTAIGQMNSAFLQCDLDGEWLSWYSKKKMCYSYTTLVGDSTIVISDGPLAQ